MKNKITLTLILILSILLVACNDKKETLKETETEATVETKLEKTSKIEITTTLKNYDINKSTNVIAKITETKAKKDQYTVMNVTKGKEKDEYIISKDLLENKEYNISLIPTINEDGSINEIKENFKLKTNGKKILVNAKSKHIENDKVTKKQLENILKQTKEALEKGDKSLIKTNGKKILEKVTANMTKIEVAKKENIKPLDTKVIKETNNDKNVEQSKEKETQEKTFKNNTSVSIQQEDTKTEEKNNNTSKSQAPKREETTQKKETKKQEKLKKKVWVVDQKAQPAVYKDKWIVDQKAQDPIYKTKCVVTKKAWVETTDELIDFDQIVRERWFVYTKLGKEYYYSSREAADRHHELGQQGYTGNWGTAEDEIIITNKKYKTIEHPEEKKCSEVLVKEGVEEKGHYEKVLVKEAVEEKGHWE